MKINEHGLAAVRNLEFLFLGNFQRVKTYYSKLKQVLSTQKICTKKKGISYNFCKEFPTLQLFLNRNYNGELPILKCFL